MNTSTQEIKAFVASVTLHDERQPISYDDASATLNEWISEGMELPEGINAQIFADEYNRMIADERSNNMNANINPEAILRTARAECLRGMESPNMDVRAAWYYTHCGEIEMAAALGAITIERMNALLDEWRDHNPDSGYPEIQRDPDWTEDEARAWDMQAVADNALRLLRTVTPGRDLTIAYCKPDADTIGHFTEWQRQRCGILTGNEYFLIWEFKPDWDNDDPQLLYAVNVTHDSLLTASAELTDLLSRKF